MNCEFTACYGSFPPGFFIFSDSPSVLFVSLFYFLLLEMSLDPLTQRQSEPLFMDVWDRANWRRVRENLHLQASRST